MPYIKKEALICVSNTVDCWHFKTETCELPEQLVILLIRNFDLVLWFSPAIKKIWFKAKAHWLMFYTDVIMFTQMCFESLIMEDFLGPATWQAVVIWKLNLYNIYLQSFFQEVCQLSLSLSKWFIWSLCSMLFSFWGFKSFHNKSLTFNNLFFNHSGAHRAVFRTAVMKRCFITCFKPPAN